MALANSSSSVGGFSTVGVGGGGGVGAGGVGGVVAAGGAAGGGGAGVAAGGFLPHAPAASAHTSNATAPVRTLGIITVVSSG